MHRRETNPPTHTTTRNSNMSANLDALIATLEDLQLQVVKSFQATCDLAAIVKDQQQQQIQQVSVNEPVELAPFNAFLTVELTPYFGAKGATMIVEKLRRCRAIADFRYFIPIYKMAGDDLKKRQLLKAVSAVYRYKFGGYKNPEQYSLRSEIKYAAACDDCGELANILVNRLKKEGLWK